MKWTDQEIVQLKNLYAQGFGSIECAKKLRRTKGSVRNKTMSLGITKNPAYTEEDISYIKIEYKRKPLKQIAKDLGRLKNYQNLCRVARRLGLTDTHRKVLWTEEQLQFLINNHDKMTYADISLKIGKPLNSPKLKLKELKIRKGRHAVGMWQGRTHPKGMLGKNHTGEARGRMSVSTKETWKNMSIEDIKARGLKQRATKIKNNTLNSLINQKRPYSRARGGKREDLGGQYFRSAWEANIARYFNLLDIRWQYEPKCFVFKNVSRAPISYTPDFYLPDEDLWIEVKGWMDPKSKSKLKRFKKYYPEESAKLEIYDESRYKSIAKSKQLIPNWE